MQTEITNELLARIYGAYIGADFAINEFDKWHNVGAITNPIHLIELSIDKKVAIILNPLSSITDENAIAACSLYKPEPFEGSRLKHWKVTREKIKEYDYIQVVSGENHYTFNIDCFFRTIEMYNTGEQCEAHSSVPVIDFLRSKEYDCGYGEIPSLIAAGIAIDKTTLKP